MFREALDSSEEPEEFKTLGQGATFTWIRPRIGVQHDAEDHALHNAPLTHERSESVDWRHASTDHQRWARVPPVLAWKRPGLPTEWTRVLEAMPADMLYPLPPATCCSMPGRTVPCGRGPRTWSSEADRMSSGGYRAARLSTSSQQAA